MKNVLLIFLFILLATCSRACLNGETRMLKNGTFLYEDYEDKIPYGHQFVIDEYIESALNDLDSLYNVTKDLDYLSDKGFVLVLLKRYDEAIQLYLSIEKMEPNRYSTASNIGTAYELKGDNENALKWIKRCVEIDPESHYSSEWIHVKILEAKIKGEDYYTTSNLLNTDFGSGRLPESNLSKDEIIKLSFALYYQLNERASFIQPEDKMMALLLFDLANAEFLHENYAIAEADYRLAKKYGNKNPFLEERIEECKKLSIGQKEKNLASVDTATESGFSESKYKLYTIAILSFSFLAIVFFIVYKRRISKNKNQ